jgi:hypothetical protein
MSGIIKLIGNTIGLSCIGFQYLIVRNGEKLLFVGKYASWAPLRQSDYASFTLGISSSQICSAIATRRKVTNHSP